MGLLKGSALWVCDLYMRLPEKYFSFFLPEEGTVKQVVNKPGSGASADVESVGFLITDFPAPRTVGNQFLLSTSHLTCSSSLYCKPTSQYFSTSDFWVGSWPCLVQNLIWLSLQHAGAHMGIREYAHTRIFACTCEHVPSYTTPTDK